MRLTVGDYEVPTETLLYVKVSFGPFPVSFGGMVEEDESPALIRKLKLLAEQRALHYDVVDKEGVSSTGICNLVHLKFEKILARPPRIRFSAQLAHPFIT